ncbi:MAG: hypothetical protein WD733_00680 [Bryobacterales bacterium]|jgi:hypothetical protein
MLKWLLSLLSLSLLIPEISPAALQAAWAVVAFPLFVMAPPLFFGGVTFALLQRTDL